MKERIRRPTNRTEQREVCFLIGRGGTVLQPGVALLERAEDFPADAPILVITDAECDVVRIRREHAFLVPLGARLPFTPRGPVFHMAP